MSVECVNNNVLVQFRWLDADPEYPGVEDDHDEAGDVEAAEGGVDDEVRIVEHADHGLLLRAQAATAQGLVVSLGTGRKIS